MRKELKEVFRKIGLAVQGFTDSARRKFVIALDAEKAKLDPETRRKVRVFWVSVCIVLSAICGAAGWCLHVLVG